MKNLKNYLFALLGLSMFLFACDDDTDSKVNDDDKKDDKEIANDSLDYREEMRDFVIGISKYAKSAKSDFLVIPQNGIELISSNSNADGQTHSKYLDAIDAHGQEDLLYGYNDDDQATPKSESDYIISFLNISKNAGNKILVTDYCSTPANMDSSYSINNANGYVSFAADQRDLTTIPSYSSPFKFENDFDITNISHIKNFLYLINPENYGTKSEFISAVVASNYDLLIMDLFSNDGVEFTSQEIQQLRSKANGGTRLVIAYMSIGEAEDYRFYWNADWGSNKPDWMDAENPDWTGNFKVKYWTKSWQDIIYGTDNSYLQKIIDADFDGVYLDIIDGFYYFEQKDK